jgi:hypothetical protein
MIYLSIVLTLGVVLLIVAFDASIALFLYLMWQFLLLRIRSIPILLRLRWDILTITLNKGKYLDQARKLRAELGIKDDE